MREHNLAECVERQDLASMVRCLVSDAQWLGATSSPDAEVAVWDTLEPLIAYLDKVEAMIRQMEQWADTLELNASGAGSDATRSRCLARAGDLRDALAMLRSE